MELTTHENWSTHSGPNWYSSYNTCTVMDVHRVSSKQMKKEKLGDYNLENSH